MNVTAVKTRLAEIQRGIPGVRRAYDAGPASLPDTDLPIFINFTGAQNLESAAGAGDEIFESRDFVMRLYVQSVQSGLDGQAESKAEAFIEPVHNEFDREQLLAAVPFIRDAVIVSDTGVSVLTYAGVQYLGTEFRLRVRAFRAASY